MNTQKSVSSSNNDRAANKRKNTAMKTETKKWGWKVKVDKATEEAGIKYANLTKDTVKKLDAINVKTWWEMGAEVRTYVLKVTENETIYVNAHKLLAESSGLKYGESMLRKLEGAYKLSLKMKEQGKSVNVSLTHILAVLHADANFDKKVELLKEAEDKGHSVSKLKKRVKAETQTPTEQNAENGIDYESSVKRVKSSVCNCYSYLSEFNRIKGNKTLPKDIRNDLVSFLDFVIAQGFVNPSELNINNPIIEERRAA